MGAPVVVKGVAKGDAQFAEGRRMSEDNGNMK